MPPKKKKLAPAPRKTRGSIVEARAPVFDTDDVDAGNEVSVSSSDTEENHDDVDELDVFNHKRKRPVEISKTFTEDFEEALAGYLYIYFIWIKNKSI